MNVKKKSLVSKGKGVGGREKGSKVNEPGGAKLGRGVVLMRQVVAKKLAVEKLVTAKRQG